VISNKFQKSVLVWYFGLALSFLTPVNSAVSPQPKMPPKFDRETMQHLLDKAEQGDNAALLKIDYFASRRVQVLSTTEGYRLLKQAVDGAPVNSRRWFILQSIRGFAGLRLGQGWSDDGVNAYEEIFDQASHALTSNASNVLQRAVYELVVTVPGDYGKLSVKSPLLLKAYSTYLASLQQPNHARLDIPWAEAIDVLGDDEKFIEVANKVLGEAATSKNYQLLWAAAAAYQKHSPEQAIKLLLQAKPLIGNGNKRQVQSFYSNLVKLLAANGRVTEALETQQESIKISNQGWAKLVSLSLQNKDETAFKSTMVSVSAPEVPESEIMDTASTLFFASDDLIDRKLAWDEAIQLLTSYLNVPRTRSPEQELQARLMLARAYKLRNKIEDAKAILTLERFAMPLPTRLAQLRYNAARQLLNELNQQSTSSQGIRGTTPAPDATTATP
jgi:tetratricopeptide (TPR) repeat protein